jgi:hypothetical protein
MHFLVKSTFEKQPQPNILYIFFTVYKPQLYFLPNTYLNSTNHIFLKLIFLKSHL